MQATKRHKKTPDKLTLESISRNMAIRQTRAGSDSAEGSGDAGSAENAIISARAGADGAGAGSALVNSADRGSADAGGAEGGGADGGSADACGAGGVGDADGGADGARAVSLADEQAYVSMLYGLLDTARARSESALAGINAQGTPGGNATFRPPSRPPASPS